MQQVQEGCGSGENRAQEQDIGQYELGVAPTKSVFGQIRNHQLECSVGNDVIFGAQKTSIFIRFRLKVPEFPFFRPFFRIKVITVKNE
jgi:hypothetical protein